MAERRVTEVMSQTRRFHYLGI
jgi:hypothetical protein